MGINIGQVLRHPAVRHPERVALVERLDDRRVEHTYRALDEGARRAAAALRSAGVRPGDRVALMAGNRAAFVEAWFGVMYAGCAVVPLPVVSAPPEVRHRVEHARCAALVTDGATRALGAAALSGLARRVPLLDEDDLVSAGGAPWARPEDTDPVSLAMVLYTSGTTGVAKGAAISHASLLAHTAVLAQHALRLGPEDTVLGALPLTHSFGCRMVMLASFFAQARCVLVPRFDAARTLALMTEERVTWVPAVPTMFAAWASAPEGPPPPALRWCLSAGAPLPDDVARRAEARLGAEVRQGYGMTEATFSTLNAPPEPRALGSVGRGVWGVEVRVVDPDGEDVPPGAEGEIVVRGHNAMLGYLDDPEATREVTRGGWLHTGDVGVFNEHGDLSVVDRIKDLILRGGHNVYPSEVEAALASHPAVAAVAVVGRPDAYYGEEVVAVVVAREGQTVAPASLAAWARERVARTKVPREVAVVEALPLGPSGKVLKRALRAWLVEGRLVPVPVPHG